MKKGWIYNTPIAHRGLHNHLYPENSIPAFEEAVKKGYAIELDVQLSKDGVLVVFHDYSTARMTGKKGKISELTIFQIRKLNLLHTDYKIPLLREVLLTVNGKVPILIETKNKGMPGKLELKLCDMLNQYDGEFAVQSFNPLSLIYIKNYKPLIMLGQIYSGKDIPSLIRNFIFSLLRLKISPHFIAYNIRDLPNPKIERLRKNTCIIGWTVRNQKDLNKARKYCDNIIFENIIIEVYLLTMRILHPTG